MAKSIKKDTPPVTVASSDYQIRYPLLWLILIVVILYLPTISMGMTDLDDGVFINSKNDLYEHFQNLYLCFQRSLWGTDADLMYRPVGTDVMILNYHLANHGTNIWVFHLGNILLHIISVLLIYQLFIKLGVKKLHAFILAMVFAVHPVLTEAVSWISARIETILCIFILAFLIKSIDYAKNGKISGLLLSALFLLLALFDKETAVAAAPVAFVLLAVVLRHNWRSRRCVNLYCSWACCYTMWFVARSIVLSGHTHLALGEVVGNVFYRMLTMVQYLGKIFLPFNLSVFPLQEDTGYYYGIVGILLLGVLLFLNKKRDMRIIAGGIGIFVLFLAPTFFIPKSMNVQIFEYRLYIPMIGVLLILSQTSLLQNKLNDKQLLARSVFLCCILAGLNFVYQQYFSDPLTFWTQAERSSPHSAYAKMMLSARVDDPAKSEALFLEAYKLDPNQRMLNFIYGVRLQDKDSILASEKYLLAEKNKSGYYQCDYYLARVAMAKKDNKAAIAYLESYLKNDKKNTKANNNLLLLYLDTDQDDKAKEQAIRMRDEGLDVPKAVIDHFHL